MIVIRYLYFENNNNNKLVLYGNMDYVDDVIYYIELIYDINKWLFQGICEIIKRIEVRGFIIDFKY